jgi:hypothetical protein
MAAAMVNARVRSSALSAAADYCLTPELKAKLDDLTAEHRRGDAGR